MLMPLGKIGLLAMTVTIKAIHRGKGRKDFWYASGCSILQFFPPDY